MKVVLEKRDSVIRLPKNFARLVDISRDGFYVYEFMYEADVASAVVNDVNCVKVSVLGSVSQPEPDIFAPVRMSRDKRKTGADPRGGDGDLQELVDSILLNPARQRDHRRARKINVITSVNTDISSRLGNDVISQGCAADDLESLAARLSTKRVIKLRRIDESKSQNKNPSLLQTSKNAKNTQKPKARLVASQDLLYKSNTDPASVFVKLQLTNGTARNMAGLCSSDPQEASNVDRDKLRSDLLGDSKTTIDPFRDLPETSLLPYSAQRSRRIEKIKKTVKIPRAAIFVKSFIVRFELLDSRGAIIDTIQGSVEHNQNVRLFNTPKIVPIVSVSGTRLGTNVLSIKQKDPVAERVKIFRKEQKTVDSDSLRTGYTQIADIELKNGEDVKFKDRTNNSSTIIYRCIPVGPGGILASVFGSVVARAQASGDIKKSDQLAAASLATTIQKNRVIIEVTSVAPAVISLAMMRRDLTVYEKEFSFIQNEPLRQIPVNVKSIAFEDSDVKQDHIYEYAVRLYYVNGRQEEPVGSTLQKFVRLTERSVNIDFSNLEVNRTVTTVDVSFDISTKIEEKHLDVVKAALERQGLNDLFSDALEDERDGLQPLIVHAVRRIDLTTGREEDFRVFTGTRFSDREEGKKLFVRPLQPGRTYRYLATTLLRAPETMFSKLRKVGIDPSSGREYTYTPSISRHPMALNRGTIVTDESAARNHSGSPFEFGRIANESFIDINVPAPLPAVSAVSAEIRNPDFNRIRWTIDGPSDQIDHFIISKEAYGSKSVVGVSHAVAAGKSYEFFADVDLDDVGEMTYTVTPVYNDYAAGAPKVSNGLVIEDGS